MSTPEELIFARIAADAPLGDLIGDRCYPLLAPQDADRPYLIYRRASTRFANTLDGYTGSASLEFELTGYAETYAAAKALAAAAATSLSGWRDQTTTPKIDRVQITNESDGSALDVFDGREQPVFTVSQTYTVHFEES